MKSVLVVDGIVQNVAVGEIEGWLHVADDFSVGKGMVQAGVNEFSYPAPTIEQQASAIKEQIVTLEKAQIMPRATREFMLTLFRAQAAAGGITEAMLLDPQHPSYSAAYAKLKAFDNRIVALRAQL